MAMQGVAGQWRSVTYFSLRSSILLCSLGNKRRFSSPFRATPAVIVSTNVAETSITISDVIFVVDCGTVKGKQYELFNGVARRESVTWINPSARYSWGLKFSHAHRL
jgi:hypothetical protein